jgi:hypothetical protein
MDENDDEGGFEKQATERILTCARNAHDTESVRVEPPTLGRGSGITPSRIDIVTTTRHTFRMGLSAVAEITSQ